MMDHMLGKVDDALVPSACYTKLDACKESIRKHKPSLSKVEEAVDRVLTPSSPKDWHEIRFFERINDSVKNKFRKFQKKPTPVELREGGECGSGNAAGIVWDKKLSTFIDRMKRLKLQFLYNEGSLFARSVEFYLSQEIFKTFGIYLLESRFPLYGYASDETGALPNVYFWHGEADAIGWYKNDKGKGRYVIVDWKVLDILDFWERNKDAYGKYLHQCLIYARLLQLHMKLNYLPHILIVPISSITGKDIHPALFWSYPKECKEAIKGLKWSVTLPEPTMKVRGGYPFHPNVRGRVDRNLALSRFVMEFATVGELLDSLGLPQLEII